MPATTVLAIDTATEFCSVALLAGDNVFEATEAVGQGHSQRALPLVHAVLEEAGRALRDLDAVAFGAGPGSFTGLRIACGIAQGLAYGAGKPVLAIGNLRALAARTFAQQSDGRRALIAIDARMNEAYCAVYQRDEHVSELLAPALLPAQALGGLAQQECVDIVAGNALSVFADSWPQAGGNWHSFPELRASARDIGTLARIDFGRGLAVAAAHASPHYVRDRVALTVDERRSRAQART
jgi:tRNA threonylcarbamoyladenosine biosynthesis protein TsaB